MRDAFRKGVTIAAALAAAAGAAGSAAAQERITTRWAAGTRWSGYRDCSAVLISLAPGGGLTATNGRTGSWQVTDGLMHVTLGIWSARMRRTDAFTLRAVDRSDAGSQWTQCDPAENRPLLTAEWLAGSRWSGFADCRVVLSLERGGRLTVSNGVSGRWSVSRSQLVLDPGGNPITLGRIGDSLAEITSGGRFTRCQ